jgi:hypothetical protein
MPLILLDLILFGVALEAVILSVFLRRRSPALIAPALLFLASGAVLLFAVRLAADGAGLRALGPVLLGGGVLHGFCLMAAGKVWRQAIGPP